MSLGTMRLGQLTFSRQLWALTSLQIFLMGDRLKMVRVHTRRIPAEMIDLKSFGDRPDESLIGETVREPHLPCI